MGPFITSTMKTKIEYIYCWFCLFSFIIKPQSEKKKEKVVKGRGEKVKGLSLPPKKLRKEKKIS